jgi:RNA recognition motif-containing protein
VQLPQTPRVSPCGEKNEKTHPPLHLFPSLFFSSSPTDTPRRPATPDHALFVGDLAPEVTDAALAAVFRAKYQSVRSAKVR